MNIVSIYSEVLQMSGYKVHSFTDRLLAYAHIKKSLDKYSLLIIDYRMPQMNGLRLATKLI